MTFLASGSAASAESSLSSLSYPPNAPNAGAGVGAGRFLLVSDVFSGPDGSFWPDDAGWRGSAKGSAGDGVAVGSDVVLDSDGQPKSLTFVSFFLITPFSRDLTFFLEGTWALLDLEADDSDATVESAFDRCDVSSVGDGIGPDLFCIRLRYRYQ